MLEDNNLINDLVGIGCHLCGTLLNQDHGYEKISCSLVKFSFSKNNA